MVQKWTVLLMRGTVRNWPLLLPLLTHQGHELVTWGCGIGGQELYSV